MKKILLSFLIIIPLLSYGQLIDELPKAEDGNLCYREVVPVYGLNKEQLYMNSKRFFIDSYNSLNDVIQVDDKESALIVGKGFNYIPSETMGSTGLPFQMWYTIKIQSKDGRYKYEIYDIFFIPPPRVAQKKQLAEDIFDKGKYFNKDGYPNRISMDYINSMENNIQSLIVLIKTFMTQSEMSGNNKDNW